MSGKRTTGNEPAEAMDPGGTHSTKPGHTAPDGRRTTPQTVEGGDQNTHPQRNTGKD